MLEGDGLVKVLGCHFKAFCFNNLHYFVWTTHSCFPLTSLSAEPGIASPPHPDAVAPGMAVGGCVGGGSWAFLLCDDQAGHALGRVGLSQDGDQLSLVPVCFVNLWARLWLSVPWPDVKFATV